MLIHRVLQPEGWPRPSGYANGVAARGTTLYLAGQVGWTSDRRFEAEDFIGQVAQALKNVVAVLAAGGAEPRHLVRMVWYVTDKTPYRALAGEVGSVYRLVIGPVYPAMTLVEVKSLLEDQALVEIECTAVVPD
ncbi:MAG: RidA family protein [Alphaproteobacteria bacterium]